METMDGRARRGINVFTGSSIICLYFSSSVKDFLILLSFKNLHTPALMIG